MCRKADIFAPQCAHRTIPASSVGLSDCDARRFASSSLVLRRLTDNAHKNGIWVGICGELGADLELTETFLAMGIDELSVSPRAVLPLRNAVRMTDTRENGPKILASLADDFTPHV